MAIRSRQIGASTEENLLYEILKLLQKLERQLSSSTVTTTTTAAP